MMATVGLAEAGGCEGGGGGAGGPNMFGCNDSTDVISS